MNTGLIHEDCGRDIHDCRCFDIVDDADGPRRPPGKWILQGVILGLLWISEQITKLAGWLIKKM